MNRVTIEIVEGDILSQSVRGIAISTDTTLNLSPTLLEKTGESVQVACREIGWCNVGSAAITTAGNLPQDKIIHVVGPRWGEGGERAKLTSATLRCLQLAEENKLKSIALPAVSTGVYGYPVENCATVMLNEIIDYTFEDLKHLRTVLVCLQNPQIFTVFHTEFELIIQKLAANGNVEVRA